MLNLELYVTWNGSSFCPLTLEHGYTLVTRPKSAEIELWMPDFRYLVMTRKSSTWLYIPDSFQVSSLVADKMGLEKEAHDLGEKVVGLERKTLTLKEENNNLQNDLNNLVQVCLFFQFCFFLLILSFGNFSCSLSVLL